VTLVHRVALGKFVMTGLDPVLSLRNNQMRGSSPRMTCDRESYSRKMHVFTHNTVTIAYEVWGEGRPVLLVHGFASTGRVNWVDTGWVRSLNQAGFQAITFDNRGHGRSSKFYDPKFYSASLMADDACRLSQHLGHEHVAVIGYSMGARIAALLAIEFSERVTAAVLSGLAANMIRGIGDHEAIARALEADSLDAVSGETARAFRSFAEQTGSDLKALAACIRSARQTISEEELQRITVPVLVAAGSEDLTAGPVEPLVAAIPGAKGVILPGRNHMNAVGDRLHKDSVVAFLKAAQ
jgi:pimeloyl-ACP methyl ester carboxylesterase